MRRATRADIALMAGIHARAFAPAEVWSSDVFDLQLMLPNVFGLLHCSGGLIMTRMAADEAEVLTLAVVADVQRRGIGGALLRAAIAMASALGAREIFLEVSAGNIAGRALYTKAGFIQAGLRRQYYPDLSDALVLRLDVDPLSGNQ